MPTPRRFARAGLVPPLMAACMALPTLARADADRGDHARCASAADGIRARMHGLADGSAFVRRLVGLGGDARDRAIRDELLAGNLPSFLRRPVPVTVSTQEEGRRVVRVTVCVLPDYLAVGSDADHVRVPMGLPSALAVARELGFTLPTRRLVDAIHAQAQVRLTPQPLPPGPQMASTETFVRHDTLVRAQRGAVDAPPTALTAGHKKDLVLTRRLWEVPGRLALYGWHRPQGAPIQPLSLVHGERYADYSHGIRLVGTTVFVDGRPKSIFEALRDATLSRALSDEGPLQRVREL